LPASDRAEIETRIVREWLKANGGPPALIIVGIGLLFGFWPLGAALIVLGALMWLNTSPRVPWKLVREVGSIDVNAPLPTRFVGRRILIADLPPMVRGRIFERCEIVGPSPALLADCKIDGSQWLGLFDHSFVVIKDVARPPEGTVYFVDCQFLRCELQNFIAVGTEKQLDGLRAAFVEAD
jgi:hypothetical protein